MDQPIVVLGFPRTGCSLVTGLIHKNGAWVGTTQKSSKNPTGHWTNLPLKRLMQSVYGQGVDGVREPANMQTKVLDTIYADGYTGGPWVMKHCVTWWKFWGGFDPIFVAVKREREAIIRSNKDAKICSLRELSLEDAVDEALAEMRKFPQIDPDRLIDGDYHQLEAVLHRAGLTLKDTSLIDRDLWKHRSRGFSP